MLCVKSFLRYNTIRLLLVLRDKTWYYDLPVAFDIETSSFDEDGEPRACMYAWQMCFGDLETMGKRLIVIGRTWREWLEFIEKIQIVLKLGERYILIYCHNLAFEFQFLRSLFERKGYTVSKMIARETRKPITFFIEEL